MCSKNCECKFNKYKELLGQLKQVKILEEDLEDDDEDEDEFDKAQNILDRRDALAKVAGINYELAEAVLKGDYSDCDDNDLLDVINVMKYLDIVEQSYLISHCLTELIYRVKEPNTDNSQET